MPRTYDIRETNDISPLKKSTNSAGLDLRALSELVAVGSNKAFIDPAGAYLFVNFHDVSDFDRYQSTAVIFPDGAVVTWYMPLEAEMELASDILSFHRSSLATPVEQETVAIDQFDAIEHIETMPISQFTVEPGSRLVNDDTIALTMDDSTRSNEMLAVSMALVAAVRMNVIESRMKKYIIDGQNEVNTSLSSMNQWKLSDISARVFEAEKGVHRWRYLLSSMHHTTVPDTLWEHDSLDKLFDSVTEHFELNARHEDLQNQLTYYSDFLKTVGDYVRHGYSSRLEKIIILIIAIEAAIALRHLYLEIVIPPIETRTH